MAYDRYDARRGSLEDRSRWTGDRYEGHDRGPSGREERGFFERAGDEIASWFGDEDSDRRGDRDSDDIRRERYSRDDAPLRGYGWRSRFSQDRDYRDRDRAGHRPLTGDYGRSEGQFAASGYRDDDRRTGVSPASGRSPHDPHYHEWRQRQISELDRDYDEYRRENQSRFESEFGSWRERRQAKRQLLGQIRENMEVVGNDDQHVGTIDRVAGDRIILTKSDPEAGGAHHSLTCNDVASVDGDRVVLECTAEQARQRWRDETRNRALFEREDQGEAGPHMLDRSFSGTYR